MIKLALTGKPKSGKTTAVIKLVDCLKRNGIKVGGFYTVEVTKDDKRIGFDMVDTITGNCGILARSNKESKIKVGRYGIKVENLEKVGVSALRNGLKDCQVIVVDEVGPMELQSKMFKETVRQILSSNKSSIFTVHYKSEDDLVQEIKMKSKLYEITPGNRKKTILDLFDQLVDDFNSK